MTEPHQCTYVTRGWGVHDKRWTAALRDNGFSVTNISLEQDGLSIEKVRRALVDSTDPVLAGPLDIAQALIGIPAPLFGLSWGFDLVQSDAHHERLDWLIELSGLIVDSTNTRNIALNAGLDASRIHTIPWGVDLTNFSPEGAPIDLTDFGVPEGNKIILSLRAFEPLYRVKDIIMAFAKVAHRIQDTHLVIGNDGSLRSQLQNLVTSLQLENRVSFIGSLPEECLPGLLRAADVYVTASEVDGSSVTLLQAMACGAPVVASNTPGNSEWISPGVTGLLFQVDNPADLATNLDKMLNHTRADSTLQLVSSAREMVERQADWAKNTEQLPQILLTHP